ncbi:MAG: EAL domain-containing protein [Burkholderiaceae bacterium]|nr:EAL domain-containing protein [Burkholderiaceae bacterium]
MNASSLNLFLTDEDVAAFEAGLPPTQSAEEHLLIVIAMAWHLRQRDCARAQELADEAETLLRTLKIDKRQANCHRARIHLVRAEIKSLHADLDGAERQANAAITVFDAHGDRNGAGDGRWLLASIWHDRGDRGQVEVCLQQTLDDYLAGSDRLRIEAVRARSLAHIAFSEEGPAAASLAQFFPDNAQYHDSVLTWIANAHANIAALTGDPGGAIKYDLQAHHTARNTGQIRQALNCAVNAAEGFATLGDLDTALEWAENALSLARANHWPASIGICLMQSADVLRLLGRYEEASAFLKEALTGMETMEGSRAHQNLLGILGQLALDTGDNAAALDWFGRFEGSLDGLRDPDLLIESRRGAATALLRLGKLDEADAKAQAAFELAREKGNAEEQIKTLQVFAEMYRDHSLPPPPGMTAPSAPLHYLHQALQIAETVSGYTVPAELLNQVANEYAACGDFRSAYEMGLATTAARNKTRVAEAQQRALAMQIRHEMDQARAETEQHIRLAATLQETNATLETLGLIGRELTASLDAEAVLTALHRHVDRLLDSITFVIYLLDESGRTLRLAFGIEAGQPYPYLGIPISTPTSYVARCARERREIVVDELDEAKEIQMTPGTLQTLSMLFAPLEVGKRLLGVMTIQSQRAHAYGERECSIFRTLCAYGAIALDNAAAYSAVEAARRKAAGQEQELRIAAIAFESQEGMMIADADFRILRVNSAFTRITGAPAEEVMDKDPAIFRSDRYDEAFYEAMGKVLKAEGTWKGEFWARRADGEVFPVWLSITAVRSDAGNTSHYVYSIIDITERKLAEDEIRNLAFYDPLTKLPNRRLLNERLRHALATSVRNANEGALLFIDLDNFKKLNDTRGHEIGDFLLEEVGRRLSTCLRQGDTAARLGGDEFVVLLEALGTHALEAADGAETVAKKIQDTLTQPYLLQGKEHHSTPSIGVCLFKGQDVTADDLLKQADLAMYQAKAAGRNTIRFFDPEMQEAVSAHAAMEADLRRALLGEQFVLHYQIQVDSSGGVVGAEALVRWRHPERGMVSPAAFIPLAEETGLILPLGEWVLDTACKQLKQWAQQAETRHLSLAVNISARQFHDTNFVSQVLAALERNGVDPRKLKLELTESLLLKDVDAIIAKMKILMNRGVRFSLDDFGTGYSSLSYLKQLPLEQLKIDQSFVRDIFVDANDLAIVRAIVTLGRSLGLAVIAEGVETEEQRAFLEASGCNTFQGYLFGKPCPADQLKLRVEEPVVRDLVRNA